MPVQGDMLDSADAPTGRVDYLKIQRFRVDHEKSEGGYGGSNLPGNKQATTLSDEGVVYIAMPQSISTSYQADYNAINMGIAGVLGAGVAAAIGGGSDADQLTNQVMSAASAALPELAYNKGASIISGLANLAGLETGINGAALQNLVKGRIMNPFTEQIFNGVQFRNHQFTIKMVARSKKEAEDILQIIKYIKKGAMPMLGDAVKAEEDQLKASELGQQLEAKTGDDKSVTEKVEQAGFVVNRKGKFLQIPDRFQLSFVRFDASTGKLTHLPHYKFQPCVCTNVSVNYTPDGQYVSFKDGIADLTQTDKGGKQILVPAVELGMSFAETRFITQSDIVAGY